MAEAKKTIKKVVKKPAAKKPVAKKEVSNLFAVIQTGGKQYIVREGDELKIEKLNDAKEGANIVFDKVLLIVKGDDVKIGTPVIEGAKVTAKSEGDGRAKKIMVIRYKPKVRYSKKKGHRQPYTKVTITGIK